MPGLCFVFSSQEIQTANWWSAELHWQHEHVGQTTSELLIVCFPPSCLTTLLLFVSKALEVWADRHRLPVTAAQRRPATPTSRRHLLHQKPQPRLALRPQGAITHSYKKFESCGYLPSSFHFRQSGLKILFFANRWQSLLSPESWNKSRGITRKSLSPPLNSVRTAMIAVFPLFMSANSDFNQNLAI